MTVGADVVVDEGEVRRRLEVLAEEIAERGALRTTEWRRVFARVRRHVFLPRYLHDDDPGSFPARWRVVDSTNPDDHSEWFDAVYSDRTLIVDLKGEPIPPERGGGNHPIVTSSSTLPGLMIRMLEDLDIADGMQVLEIGTGTGYNAALLSERLGDTHVTSIDIDPELVALARGRLAAHGYYPRLVAGDGEFGVPHRTYDRVIATCGVDHVPYSWVAQTSPGGKIMANLRGPLMHGALVLLAVAPDGTASGSFLPNYASFMPIRHDPTTPYDYAVKITRPDTDPVEGFTTLDPASLHNNAAWGFVAQTWLSGAAFRLVTDDDGESLGTEIATLDGSWAVGWHTNDNDRYRTNQAGPRRLWDILEHAHEQWAALGQPRWDRFRLNVTKDRQRISLDTPDSERTWSWDIPELATAQKHG